MRKVVILGDEKKYFANLVKIFKNSGEFCVTTDLCSCDLLFTIGSVSKELVDCCAHNKHVHFGRVPPMIDPMFVTTQEIRHVYDGYAYQGTSDRDNLCLSIPYVYLPYPIDVSSIQSYTIPNPSCVIQGAGSASRYNKMTSFTELMCKACHMPFESIIGVDHQVFLDSCHEKALLVIDQYFRGEMGCTCWEMLALDIPVACHVRDETKDEMEKLFGSLPPIEYLDGPATIVAYSTVADRQRNVQMSLREAVTKKYVRDGSRKEWVNKNLSFKALEKYYGDFFRAIIDETIGGRI